MGRALGHPLLGFFHARGAGADEVQAALAMALDEMGFFEDAEMFGETGRRDSKRLGQERDGAFAAFGETQEDAAARGVGEGGEDGGDLGLFVNHRANYSGA